MSAEQLQVDHLQKEMLERERIANRRKHWVRAVTACNSKCVFCLDSDTPRNVYLPEETVKGEIDRGRRELDADKIIISGGEASLHPLFPEFVRYAKSVGYDRVQTVTNGYRFAEREFFEACMEAGLGEITFSLHGHTPELHDHLTQTPGAFRRLMKGMIRAIRDGRPIVNVDVVINKQNVEYIDKIVELCISVGVTEFDLLHVIPHAAAFDNRDQLFYDPREHIERLQKVFRLNRHPGYVIWTNRFPVSYLEGLEDLIQDPHKMLDEVNGRRFQYLRYLNTGKPLDCRQQERCVHCFIEPFCTTIDRFVEDQNRRRCEVWWVGAEVPLPDELPRPLPYGSTRLGVEVADMVALRALRLPAGAGLYARVLDPGPVREADVPARPVTLVATGAEHLDAWLGEELPAGVDVEIHLNRATGPWLLVHRDRLRDRIDRVRIHQPSYEHMQEAAEHDVRDPERFFRELDLPVRVSGLPACLAPGTVLIEATRRLDRALFDGSTGRLAMRPLARYHVREGYRAKSLRCADCRVTDRCDGIHINMIRDQGLKLARPLVTGAWAEDAERQLIARWPSPPRRLADGRPMEAVAPSLPGYPPPTDSPEDPVMAAALAEVKRREERRRLIDHPPAPAIPGESG
jgi:MoaA/NifB/PqqE/SkfB family radical SAM enzyme